MKWHVTSSQDRGLQVTESVTSLVDDVSVVGGDSQQQAEVFYDALCTLPRHGTVHGHGNYTLVV